MGQAKKLQKRPGKLILMANRRFPVANTDPPLTVPWDVAEQAHSTYLLRWVQPAHKRGIIIGLSRRKEMGGFTKAELDEWYGPHWREVAE